MEKLFSTFITERYEEETLNLKRFDLIQKVLEKKLNQKIVVTTDTFKNARGTNRGMHFFMNNSTGSVRFNFDGEKNNVSSIDIWSNSTNGADPDSTIEIKKPTSTSGLLNLIVRELKKPEFGIFNIDDLGQVSRDGEATNLQDSKETLQEAVIQYQGITYPSKRIAVVALAKAGMAYDEISSELKVPIGDVKFYIKQAAMMTEVSVIQGIPEQMAGTQVEQAQETMEEYSDPETVFTDLEGLVKLIVTKTSPSLLVLGQPGIGKTYNVIHVIESMGLKINDDYLIVKGTATPLGVYSALFKFRNKIVVFDDCDDALMNSTTLNILKGALDSSKTRTISWLSDRTFDAIGMEDEELNARYEESGNLPNTFQVTGGVIFISNMPKRKFNNNPQLKAIVTRGWWIDITLPNKDIITLMRNALNSIAPEVDIHVKTEVLDFLNQNIDRFENREFSFRTLLRGIQSRSLGLSNWQSLVFRYA